MTYREALREGERRLLVHRLEKHNWNVTATARSFTMPWSTLKMRMKKLGIQRPPYQKVERH